MDKIIFEILVKSSTPKFEGEPDETFVLKFICDKDVSNPLVEALESCKETTDVYDVLRTMLKEGLLISVTETHQFNITV